MNSVKICTLTPFPFSGSGTQNNGIAETYFTDIGPLIISGHTDQAATFTVSAVPEPSTYAMALAGLACGGYSMWRRRKRA